MSSNYLSPTPVSPRQPSPRQHQNRVVIVSGDPAYVNPVPPTPNVPSTPIPITLEELEAKVKKQVEYYFSDDNYPSDAYLRDQAEKDPRNFVPLSLLITFPKLKVLTEDLAIIAHSVINSTIVELSPDFVSIRRIQPLPPPVEECFPNEPNKIRICTFNCENLFARYRFKDLGGNSRSNSGLCPDSVMMNEASFFIHDEKEKKLSALVIRDTNADVVCLQEVENARLLDKFVDEYLRDCGYRYRILIDGRDPRLINVALISRFPLTYLMTNRHERMPNDKFMPLFSRDCLEVEVERNGKKILLYVNHLKSMREGREITQKRRELQTAKIIEIIERKFKANSFKGNFAVLGDMNDYLDPGHGLGPLVDAPYLVNVVKRVPENDRWTHYWASGREYKQIDHIFVSKTLAESPANANSVPQIVRTGVPLRADRYTGKRHIGIGLSRPKASDHCPIFIDLVLE